MLVSLGIAMTYTPGHAPRCRLVGRVRVNGLLHRVAPRPMEQVGLDHSILLSPGRARAPAILRERPLGLQVRDGLAQRRRLDVVAEGTTEGRPADGILQGGAHGMSGARRVRPDGLPQSTPAPPPGMSPAEWEGYLRGWQRRLAQEERALETRRQRARSALPALVETLREFGATEVHLFGSLRTGVFRPASDIDLGVRGIAPDRFFAALAALDAVCDVPVDVVDLDEASPALRQRILEEGERLL